MIYTQRTRLLDEELNENKDVITSQSENGSRPDKNVKISMLMSDGVDCYPDVTYAQVDKTLPYKLYPDVNLVQIENIETKSNAHITNQKLRTTQIKNRPVSTNLTSSYSDIRDAQSQYIKYDLGIESESIRCGDGPNMSIRQSPSSYMSPDMDVNDSVMFRRQQLTRVAQWIQNNQVMDGNAYNSSTEALSIDSGYKTKVTNSGNSALLDRETNSQRSISNNNEHADGHGGGHGGGHDGSDRNYMNHEQQDVASFSDEDLKLVSRSNNYAQTNLNNNIENTDNAHNTNKSSAQVDLAQMEYNVKQFLLKQNEWAGDQSQAGPNINATNKLMNCLPDVDVAPSSVSNRKLHRTETNL